MKKIVALVGVGVLSLAFMSSTCSSQAGEAVESKSEMMAPASGISFKKKSFEEAKQEAKKSGKLIFIDAYTDWCGPCKRMAATSFKDPKVGDLFNKNFINLKVEMEKDADGPELARKYRVVAYPTLLIVDGNGKLIKQAVGMKNSDQLIALAKSVL
ncbi:MAG: thioredoxin family protein [Fluviicola sp.]